MTDKEKIENIGYALIVIAQRLLRLESSEKWRAMLRDIIHVAGEDICEIKKKKEKE